MVMTNRNELRKAPKSPSQFAAAKAINELRDSGALDSLFSKIDPGELQLTGESGFVPGLIKTALERGLQVELTEHLGYEKGDPRRDRLHRFAGREPVGDLDQVILGEIAGTDRNLLDDVHTASVDEPQRSAAERHSDPV